MVTGEATELLTGENEGYELLQEVPGLTLSLLDTNIGKSPPLSMGSLWSSQVIGAAKSAESTNNREKEGQTVITDQQATLHSVAEVSADEAILAMIEPIETELESWLISR